MKGKPTKGVLTSLMTMTNGYNILLSQVADMSNRTKQNNNYMMHNNS